MVARSVQSIISDRREKSCCHFLWSVISAKDCSVIQQEGPTSAIQEKWTGAEKGHLKSRCSQRKISPKLGRPLHCQMSVVWGSPQITRDRRQKISTTDQLRFCETVLCLNLLQQLSLWEKNIINHHQIKSGLVSLSLKYVRPDLLQTTRVRKQSFMVRSNPKKNS